MQQVNNNYSKSASLKSFKLSQFEATLRSSNINKAAFFNPKSKIKFSRPLSRYLVRFNKIKWAINSVTFIVVTQFNS